MTRKNEKFSWFDGDTLMTLLRVSQNESNFDEKLAEKLRSANLQINLYERHNPALNQYIYRGRVMCKPKN